GNPPSIQNVIQLANSTFRKGFLRSGKPFFLSIVGGPFHRNEAHGQLPVLLGIFSLKQGFNGCLWHPCASFHYGHVSFCISNGRQPSQHDLALGRSTKCELPTAGRKRGMCSFSLPWLLVLHTSNIGAKLPAYRPDVVG
ncbi:TPA: hypothetical protein ACP6NQ_004741, partial [Escherichia coli]